PVIGDYRIGFEIVPIGDISVIARQDADGFSPYQTLAGDQILIVRNGAVAADAMFADALSENSLITWLLRIVGLVLLFVGFALFMGPVGVLADIIPFLGGIARLGTVIVAFLLTIFIGTATIALAWFFYRPLLALGIIVAGTLVAFAIVHLVRSRKNAVITPLTDAS
ncbi:MAG: TMEM43 family protein, partial [Pseudaminobacter sp.]|nr:TMEM43 family protein [Pseudaminobacter sp.]